MLNRCKQSGILITDKDFVLLENYCKVHTMIQMHNKYQIFTQHKRGKHLFGLEKNNKQNTPFICVCNNSEKTQVERKNLFLMTCGMVVI